jgi:hypothetical protein
MNENFYKEALQAYTGNSENYSYSHLTVALSIIPTRSQIIKQEKVFYCSGSIIMYLKKPENVQLNYQLLWKHLKSAGIDFYIPEPKYFSGGAELYWDTNHNYWRVLEFIEDGKMLSNAETPEQAKETAQTFARFTGSFHDFDVNVLKDTIPDFIISISGTNSSRNLCKKTILREEKKPEN